MLCGSHTPVPEQGRVTSGPCPIQALSSSHFSQRKDESLNNGAQTQVCVSQVVGKPAKPWSFAFIPPHHHEYLLVAPPEVGQGWWEFGKWIFPEKKH